MQYLISGKRIGTTGGALLRICMTEVSWPGYLSHGLPNNEGANIFGRERGVVVMTFSPARLALVYKIMLQHCRNVAEDRLSSCLFLRPLSCISCNSGTCCTCRAATGLTGCRLSADSTGEISYTSSCWHCGQLESTRCRRGAALRSA